MLTQEKPTIQVCCESTPKIWDRATTKANIGDIIHAPYTPVMEVVNKKVYTDGRVWLLVKPKNASYYTEEWVLDKEDDLLPPPQTEFEQGKQHRQNDTAEHLPPIYTEASCQYSTGYLAGYNSTSKPQQTKAPATPATWSVIYDGEYWYKVWVDKVLVGKATTSEKAEQIAQKAIAGKKFWQEHRERVLAAYSD